MMMNSRLMLGYDLDKWNLYGIKEPIEIDISPKNNSHILVCGMSGAGKSYYEHQLIARLILAEQGQQEQKGGTFSQITRQMIHSPISKVVHVSSPIKTVLWPWILFTLTYWPVSQELIPAVTLSL